MPPIVRKQVYIGVDPGLGGGLACLECGGAIGWSMPETESDLWLWFKVFQPTSCPLTTVFAVIEQVHAMPGNGVSGMFKFGQSYGSLRMALTAAGIPWETATPQAWQKGLGIPKRGKDESQTMWKNRLKAKAQQLYPATKVTLATSDALLIATYCQRKRTGTL